MALPKWFLVFYHFPPSIYSGARRAGLFAQALASNFADEPIKVFVSPRSYLLDKSIGTQFQTSNISICPLGSNGHPQLPAGQPLGGLRGALHRTGHPSSFLPNPRNIHWALGACQAAVKAGIDDSSTVITMSKPYEDHITGYLLQKRFGCRWIADFRELLADHRSLPQSRLGVFWKLFERMIVRNANIVTAVTPGMAEHLATKYGRQVRCLYNGIEEKRIQEQVAALGETSYLIPTTTDLRFLYSGSLEGGRAGLFEHLLQILADNADVLGSRSSVEYWGDHNSVAADCLARALGPSGIQHESFARVPSHVVDLKQREAHILLLLPHAGHTLESRIGLTVKLFNYLDTLHPIVYYGPRRGDLFEFVKQFPHICLLDSEDNRRANGDRLHAWLETTRGIRVNELTPLVLRYGWRAQLETLLAQA